MIPKGSGFDMLLLVHAAKLAAICDQCATFSVTYITLVAILCGCESESSFFDVSAVARIQCMHAVLLVHPSSIYTAWIPYQKPL